MNVDHYQSGEEVYGEECEEITVVCLHFRHSIHFHLSPLILLLFICLFMFCSFIYLFFVYLCFVCLLKCLFYNVFEVKRLYLFGVFFCAFYFSSSFCVAGTDHKIVVFSSDFNGTTSDVSLLY